MVSGAVARGRARRPRRRARAIASESACEALRELWHAGRDGRSARLFRPCALSRASSAASRASSRRATRRSSGRRRTSTADSRQSATSPAGTPATCSPGADVLRHGGLGADDGARAQPHVTGGAGLSGHHHAVLEHRAAGDADLRGEQHVPADLARRARPARDCRSSCRRRCASRRPPGRSIVEFAPISTSSSITTRPTCGIFSCVPSGRRAKPKPSLPMTAPFCSTTRCADRDALANRRRARASRSRRRCTRRRRS